MSGHPRNKDTATAPPEPMPPFLFTVEGESPSPTMEAAFTLAHIGVATGPIGPYCRFAK